MFRKNSYWDDRNDRLPMDTYHPVVVDGKHLGEVQVAYEEDEVTRRQNNLTYAATAVDEIFPKYVPKTRIHEMSISIEMPREDRIKNVIAAVVKAMKLDEAFQEELSLSYFKPSGV